MKMKKLTATLLSAVLGVYAMAGDTLFQNGKTEWKIGFSPKAAPAEAPSTPKEPNHES